MVDAFGIELEFWQLLIFFVTTILGIIAIRVVFTFDLNKYLEGRQSRLAGKAQNYCTHMQFIKMEGDEYGFQSYFVSPPGTNAWHCQKCQIVRWEHGGDFDREAEYYMKNINVFKKKNKQFHKIVKKAGLV
ncbi:MAG: hypothetical protein ACO1N2_01385 [Candidatus Saccharimonadota bacterium]